MLFNECTEDVSRLYRHRVCQGCLAPGANRIGSGANQAPIKALAPIGANRRQTFGANQSWRQSGANHGANQIWRQSNYFLRETQAILESTLDSLPKSIPVWLIGSRRQSTGSFGANQAPIN